MKSAVDRGRYIVHEAQKLTSNPGRIFFKLFKNAIPLTSFIQDPILKVLERVMGAAVYAIGEVIGAKSWVRLNC